MIGGLLASVIWLAVVIVIIAANWKIFTKAGKPGWASIIPIYNIIVFLEIIGRPAWWIILAIIPGVNLIFGILVSLDLAKSFGKSTGFAIGLILLGPIFLLILAFGDAEYQGPAASQG
ncbi:MAG: signal peptidase I [Verrucomicrobiae bacterium]|nr:signal peptidase I [Verrucomicrobiae bacterium]